VLTYRYRYLLQFPGIDRYAIYHRRTGNQRHHHHGNEQCKSTADQRNSGTWNKGNKQQTSNRTTTQRQGKATQRHKATAITATVIARRTTGTQSSNRQATVNIRNEQNIASTGDGTVPTFASSCDRRRHRNVATVRQHKADRNTTTSR